MRLEVCGAVPGLAVHGDSHSRRPELSLKLRQLGQVYRSDYVDDRQLPRLRRDDRYTVGVVAFAQHVDINVIPLLEVVRGYHRHPAGCEELRPERPDLGLGIFAWPIEREAAHVDPSDAFDEIIDRGTAVAIVV